MNTAWIRLSSPALALLVVGAAFTSTPALAGGGASPTDSATLYQQERAVCLSGQSNQDRATCLKEAGAALAQSRHGAADENAAQQTLNASKRCDALPGADKTACQARMQGQGTTSGSVAAGGISRELVTREVGSPSAAASAAPAK